MLSAVAKRVVATDRTPQLVDLLRVNVQQSKSRCSVYQLDWNDEQQQRKVMDDVNGGEGFDLIIGSDLMCEEGDIAPLVDTVDRMLKRGGAEEKAPAQAGEAPAYRPSPLPAFIYCDSNGGSARDAGMSELKSRGYRVEVVVENEVANLYLIQPASGSNEGERERVEKRGEGGSQKEEGDEEKTAKKPRVGE
mmetsp:Transcript_8063/g.21297  ORF Transcript_8063/g.21297 Transcript_8063/m.21297 type:complete len:192 (+) Transcript_8063:492-1067(+)